MVAGGGRGAESISESVRGEELGNDRARNSRSVGKIVPPSLV